MHETDWIKKIKASNSKKYASELSWHKKSYEERGRDSAPGGWYELHFTKLFNLSHDFYYDKRLLDIGCGPRGSLEWADMASLRVGLDPLSNDYIQLGASNHKMAYIVAPAEKIPFPSAYFDVVSSFNSIDHVDEINKVINEIGRVTRPGGSFLLITDIHEKPTTNEPLALSWDFVEKFRSDFDFILHLELEKTLPNNIYKSVEDAVPYDHNNKAVRYGILKCLLRRKF